MQPRGIEENVAGGEASRANRWQVDDCLSPAGFQLSVSLTARRVTFRVSPRCHFNDNATRHTVSSRKLAHEYRASTMNGTNGSSGRVSLRELPLRLSLSLFLSIFSPTYSDQQRHSPFIRYVHVFFPQRKLCPACRAIEFLDIKALRG